MQNDNRYAITLTFQLFDMVAFVDEWSAIRQRWEAGEYAVHIGLRRGPYYRSSSHNLTRLYMIRAHIR